MSRDCSARPFVRARILCVNLATPMLPIDRRTMLRQSCAGFGWLALQGVLGMEQARAAVADPLAPKQPHFPARAKRVIFLLMKGGPSQVDTFDPKPQLTKLDGKPLPAGSVSRAMSVL